MNFSPRKRTSGFGGEECRCGRDAGDASAGCSVFCGFTGSNAALVLAGGRAVLFTDGRYTAQAKAEARGVRVVIAKKPAVAAACEWMEAAGVRRCGFDGTQTTVAGLEAMRKAVSGKVRRGLFVAVGALVARLREVKDRGRDCGDAGGGAGGVRVV